MTRRASTPTTSGHGPTLAQLVAESYRLRLMCGLEELLRRAGFFTVAGVDEAGRGALAGPVVAAAVAVEGPEVVPGVDDSKAVDPLRRARLADAIRRAHPRSAVIAVSPAEVDRINVLGATRVAMARALTSLDPAPAVAVVDAVPLDGFAFPALPVVRGDQISYAVACASILAKVTRDRHMVALHRRFPAYGFDANKGYGSAHHRAALAEHGPCPEHRLTFRSVLPAATDRAEHASHAHQPSPTHQRRRA